MEHLAVNIFYFSYRCRRRADHVKLLFRTYPADKNFYIIHGFFEKFFILAGAKNGHHMGCRWIIQKHPVTHFFFIKFFIILDSCRLNAVMFRLIRLDHRMSRPVTSAGTSHCLGQKLKGSLSTMIIIHIQGKICRNHADQSYIRKIMSLDNHLGSHQNICLMPCKRCQNFFIAVLGPCGIKIHPKYPGFRKFFFQNSLNLLGSCLKSSNMRRTTGRTDFRLRCFITTVMADQPISVMLT